MSRITEEGKRKQGRYNQVGGFIKTREMDSMGTSTMTRDWITGEVVYLLSQGERDLFYLFRFNPLIEDVYTQVRLEIEETNYIAKLFGVKPSNGGRSSMTTDFLLKLKNGKHIAVSYKDNEKELDNRTTLIHLNIEKEYWKRKGVPYLICFRKDINPVLVDNIRLVVPFYRREKVYDELTMIRHLIATHQMNVDMETQDLNFMKIRDELGQRRVSG